jgi:DNA repair protein RadA/Sms
VPAAAVLFGELGLAGEIRRVGHAEARLREAAKLGFERAILPRAAAAEPQGGGMALDRVGRIAELVDLLVDGTAASPLAVPQVGARLPP